MQAVVAANTFLTIILQGPLQQLLSSAKQLQIIVHVALIAVAYPATATVFFGSLMKLLTFQVYDYTEFYDKMFGLDRNSKGNNALNN